MYDIYLSSSCLRPLDLSAFQKVPALNSMHSQQPSVGLLELSLSGDLAAILLEQVVLAKGYGYLVPVAYRQPQVTRQMARTIAEEVIAQKQKTYFPTYTFEPVQFLGEANGTLPDEEAMWWNFGAASEELIEEGYCPGAIYAQVDKLDGHLWSGQEEASLYLHGEEYHLASATTLSPQQLLYLLAAELGLEWGTDYKYDNRTCLKGPALVVWAAKHSYPAFVENYHGFRPTVQLYFRLLPYKSGYQSAQLLLLRAVIKVLRHDYRDAVLTFDDGTLAILLQQVSKQLVQGKAWDSWSERQPVSEGSVSFRRKRTRLASRRALAAVIWEEEMLEKEDQWNRKEAMPIQMSKEMVVA